MDAFLRSDAPWQLKAALCLAIGLVPAIAILAIPLRVLARAARIPTLGPNGITLWGFVLYWVGVWMFFRVSPTAGYLLVVAASVLDVTDGRSAKAMKRFRIPRSEADRKRGVWLDPLTDKLKYLPLMGIFAWLHVVDWRIALPIIVADVIGTLMRPPFGFWQRFQRVVRATALGKIKALLQAFGLVVSGPVHLGWFRSTNAPNLLFGLALIAGVLSVISRLRTIPVVHRAINRVTKKLFSHRDVL